MTKSFARLITICALFVVSFFLLPCHSSAADFQPISPDEMKVSDVPGHPGAPAIVLYHEEKNDDNLHYHEVYMRIKVLTEAGREQANVQLPYDRHAFKITDIKGRTVHADGSIVNFEGKPFDKSIVKGRDRKYNVKAFTLPDVQVGSIIEYRYDIRYDDDSLYSPHWVLQNELFQRNVRFTFKPWMKDWVDAHGVSNNGVKWTYLTPKGTQPVEKREEVEYLAKDIQPFIEEPYMPPSDILKFNIRFYYDTKRKMEEYWKEEGKYWNKDVEHFIGDKNALRDELAKIVSPADTPEQKVRKIYAYVGTYTNLTYAPSRTLQELQALGFDNKYTIEKVIKAKTGDREDLARLFIGLVREAGLPAYAIRVTSREDSYFVPQVLSWSQLDTELAIVRLDDKEVFLDPGTRFCPYGMLLWKLAATNGVRQSASGKGTEMATTPNPSYKDAQIKRSASFTLDQSGSIAGNLQVTFFGQEALSRRIRGSRTDAEGRTKLLEDEIKGWLPDTAEVSLSNKPLWDSGDEPLITLFKISTPIVTAAGRRRLLPIHMLDFNRPALFQHAERKFPVYFDFPYSAFDEIHVFLPLGVRPESLPANNQVSLGYAVYGTEYSVNGRELTATRMTGIGDFAFPVEKYPELKSFFEKVKAGDDQQIVLTGAPNAQAK
jgi:hypothetical protein